MLFTARRLLLGGFLVLATSALAWVLWPQLPWLAAGVGLMVLGLLLLINHARPPQTTAIDRVEPTTIESLDESRHRELLRGTSLFLREMRYRYSVRYDAAHRPGRDAFSAEVNTIALGFVPAIIMENSSDRQGEGFVAFVHDGQRFRGPGLPCPGTREQAIRHARRCVSPLDEEDDQAGH